MAHGSSSSASSRTSRTRPGRSSRTEPISGEVDPGCPREFPRAEICAENLPAWSPDGRRLAFAWAYPKEKLVRGEPWIEVSAIAVMSLDGSSVRQLTQLKRPTSSGDSEPVWSPNGRQIAFVRQKLDRSSLPRSCGLLRERRRQRRPAHYAVEPRRRRLSRLVARRRADPVPCAEERPRRKQLLHCPARRNRPEASHALPSKTEVLSASYSPDGRWIVFSRTGRAGLPDLFVIRPNGTGLRQLTRTNAWESASEWGPK